MKKNKWRVLTDAKKKQKNKIEENHQKYFVEWLFYTYPHYRKFLTLGSFGEDIGAARMHQLKLMGLTPGYPDLVLYVPSNGYHALLIEMKEFERGKLQPEQIERHQDLASMGYCVKTAYYWTEAVAHVKHYLS